MELFAQLTKVDVEKRLVYGRAAQEVADKSGEIMDYVTSKPNFEKWSDDVSAASDGQSLGNLRAMHGKVAAGKLVGIEFNDAEKAIDVCTKVVDDNEWDKVLEGVYTGFSIGGSYAKRWDDQVEKSVGGKALTRYTAVPTELSLVDRPCIPTAKFFQVQKVDGIIEEVEFKKSNPEGINQYTAGGGKTKVYAARDADATYDATSNDHNAYAARDATHDAATVHAKIAAGIAYKDAKNSKLSHSDAINAAHQAGAKAYNKFVADHYAKKSLSAGTKSQEASGLEKDQKGDQDLTVKGTDFEVIAFAKYLNDNNMTIGDALIKVSNKPEGMVKNLYTCQSLASIVQSLDEMLSSVEHEEEQEQDDTDLTARLNDAVTNLGQILVDMTAAEVAELTANNKEDELPEVMEMAQMATDLVKRYIPLAKAGARNSKSDLEKIQTMHDHAVSLGAACQSAEKVDEQTELQKADILSKAIEEATAPLQKAFNEVTVELNKLKAEPAPAKAILRVVEKGADVAAELSKTETPAPVIDKDGNKNEPASLIKMMHKQGGQQLTFR